LIDWFLSDSIRLKLNIHGNTTPGYQFSFFTGVNPTVC
jgi:hypothetical protein